MTRKYEHAKKVIHELQRHEQFLAVQLQERDYEYNSHLGILRDRVLQLENELGAQIKIEGKPAVLQKFSKQCQVCLRMFYNEAKYEEDQEEHAKLIDLSGSMHCPSCYVKVAKLEINQHYLDDHP